MKEREEETVVACNALLAIIKRLPTSVTDARALNDALAFALRDMAGKCRGLPPEIGHQFYEHAKQLALAHTLHDVIEEIDGELYASETSAVAEAGDFRTLQVKERPKADVVLLTIIPEEFEAALRVFGMESNVAKREFEFRGLDFFAATIPQADRRYGKRELRVLITMVGSPRNVPCANVCRDILEKLNTEVLLLVGIAGGNRRKMVGLGDVVAGEAIIDIEGGRSELVPNVGLKFRGRGYWRDKLVNNVLMPLFGSQKVTAPRIKMESPPPPLIEYVRKFRPKEEVFRDVILRALSGYPDEALPWRTQSKRLVSRALAWFASNVAGGQFISKPKPYQAKLHLGLIMCGEKVLADGSVPEMARQHHGNILAVDMESSGFAESCKHLQHPWAVFRGISDYADPKKGDKWHVPAAVAAAAAAKLFLLQAYTPADERDSMW